MNISKVATAKDALNDLCNDLEELHESITSEIEDLEDALAKLTPKTKAQIEAFNAVTIAVHNLKDYADGLYSCFERAEQIDIPLDEAEKEQDAFNVMKDILSELLPWSEKVYYRARYGLNLD